ncbi:MAG: glycosyltransferase family 2 protein [Marinosulfonomonas sp.]
MNDTAKHSETASSLGSGRRAIVAALKNEGPFVIEWIAHHQGIGFTEFYLYSNDCVDGTDLILDRLDEMGLVTHFRNHSAKQGDPQRAALSSANQNENVRSADWVLVLDLDEYLNIHCGDGTLDALFEKCGNADAISVTWRVMGSAGHEAMTPELATKRFTRGVDLYAPHSSLLWGFKTLFRPACFDFFGIHRPRFFKDRELRPGMVKWVNGSGKDVGDKFYEKGWRSNRHNIGYELAQINHYAVRSRDEFLLKRLRGSANTTDKDRLGQEYFAKFDQNEQEDTTINTDRIQTHVDRLMQDDQLSALVEHSRQVCLKTIENYRGAMV